MPTDLSAGKLLLSADAREFAKPNIDCPSHPSIIPRIHKEPQKKKISK